MEVQREHGPDAKINMGQIFYWYVRKNPLLASTSKSSVYLNIDSKQGTKEIQYRNGINFEGEDYDHFNSTLIDCIASCYDDKRCYSWSYNAVNTTCLKKDVIPVPAQLNNFSSGWFDEKFECNRKVLCTSFTECHDI